MSRVQPRRLQMQDRTGQDRTPADERTPRYTEAFVTSAVLLSDQYSVSRTLAAADYACSGLCGWPKCSSCKWKWSV